MTDDDTAVSGIVGGADSGDPTRRSRRRWKRWLLGFILVSPLLYFGALRAGAWFYANVLTDDAPPVLSFEDRDKALGTDANSSSSASVASSPLDGVWAIIAPSTAGYRVEENIAGEKKVAVGRTSTVDGSFTLSGSTVTAAEINVDIASMKSDSDRRDDQFRGRIMATDEFPVATYTLTEPLQLNEIPADGDETVAISKGTLSLRGVEQPLSFTLQARRKGETIEIVGNSQIQFADFEIPDPSIGPVKAASTGVIELSLTAKRAG